MKSRVIAWWSGGISSALASYWTLQAFRDVAVVFIDTKNEHPDTYRFKADCEKLYGREILTLTRLGKEYETIQAVWNHFNSLNSATGAICSTELKRTVRESYQNLNTDYGQIFGFDVTERKRHINMRKNYPEINAISPLIDLNLTKSQVVAIFKDFEIVLPEPYRLGFRNNNCFQTGCVQGGIGYWQKIQREFPEKFNAMAEMEHKLTNAKGQPVTMLKDQSNEARESGNELVFLKPHPGYPNLKDISMMEGREPEPLTECIGFCSTK